MNRYYVILSILAMLSALKALPQNADSLEMVLRTQQLTASEQLKLYDKLSWIYINTDADKAKSLSRQGLEISLKENNDKMSGILFHHIGVACYINSEMDSAWYYLRKAEIYSEKAKDDFRLNRIKIAYSILYSWENDYENTINTLLQLIPQLEKNKDGDLIRTVYGNLGTNYLYIHNYPLSEKYYQLCVGASLEANDDWKLSQSYNGLIDIYIEKGEFDTALEYADKALAVAERCGDYQCQALTNQKKSEIYSRYYNDFGKSLEFAQKGLEIARSTSNVSDVSALLVNLSTIYYQNGDYQKSLNYAIEALDTDTTDASVYENIAANLVKSGIRLNEKELALRFFKKYMDLVEIRTKSEIQQFAVESEKKFETGKKELEIFKLKEQRKFYIITFLAVFFILGLFVLAVYYRLYVTRQKKQIAEQQVARLEQEKQLVATKSVLKGEERERSRIATDLHDGLGGLLSGVKLNLANMKGKSYLESDQVKAFGHVISLLDSSIVELKRIAHNMVPETLHNYGLKTAVHDYCLDFSHSGTPEVSFNFYGQDKRVSSELELSLYRIAQELVNNAVKYARATQIEVQLFVEEKRIALQVFDNGCGFDVKDVETNGKGSGLKNIRNRVSAFNGRFEIYSRTGEGAEVMIEFDI